jgi:hypothetical protein
MRIGLVACAAKKLDHPAPARDIYVSPLFRKASAYCEREYDRWYILSAKHGLVSPDTALAPYNVTLNTMGRQDRRLWADRVESQFFDSEGSFVGLAVYLHAGKRYVEDVGPWLLAQGASVVSPFPGLGIGQQMRWYIERGIR